MCAGSTAPPVFDPLTCCFLLTMGGSVGQGEEDRGLSGDTGVVGSGMATRPVLPLVGGWYLTCLSSSSVSWGACLKGELKTPGRWRERERETGKMRERGEEGEGCVCVCVGGDVKLFRLGAQSCFQTLVQVNVGHLSNPHHHTVSLDC